MSVFIKRELTFSISLFMLQQSHSVLCSVIRDIFSCIYTFNVVVFCLCFNFPSLLFFPSPQLFILAMYFAIHTNPSLTALPKSSIFFLRRSLFLCWCMTMSDHCMGCVLFYSARMLTILFLFRGEWGELFFRGWMIWRDIQYFFHIIFFHTLFFSIATKQILKRLAMNKKKEILLSCVPGFSFETVDMFAL